MAEFARTFDDSPYGRNAWRVRQPENNAVADNRRIHAKLLRFIDDKTQWRPLVSALALGIDSTQLKSGRVHIAVIGNGRLRMFLPLRQQFAGCRIKVRIEASIGENRDRHQGFLTNPAILRIAFHVAAKKRRRRNAPMSANILATDFRFFLFFGNFFLQDPAHVTVDGTSKF